MEQKVKPNLIPDSPVIVLVAKLVVELVVGLVVELSVGLVVAHVVGLVTPEKCFGIDAVEIRENGNAALRTNTSVVGFSQEVFYPGMNF
jgi:hypothetical protein